MGKVMKRNKLILGAIAVIVLVVGIAVAVHKPPQSNGGAPTTPAPAATDQPPVKAEADPQPPVYNFKPHSVVCTTGEVLDGDPIIVKIEPIGTWERLTVSLLALTPGTDPPISRDTWHATFVRSDPELPSWGAKENGVEVAALAYDYYLAEGDQHFSMAVITPNTGDQVQYQGLCRANKIF
jgi:hypothetical protein